MNYELVDNEIVFTVDTEHPGKFAFIDVLKQVTSFWEKVAFYKEFRRQPFNSITIKVNRPEWLQETSINNQGKRST